MKITKEMLRDKGACQDQRELFERLYPDGVTVTEAECVAHASEFDWLWAAAYLLTSDAYDQYDAARKPINDQYDAARAALFARLAINL